MLTLEKYTMQQETLKMNRIQQHKLKQTEKVLKEELKKNDSMVISIPALVRTRIEFVFNPASPYGRHEEMVLRFDSKYFYLDSTERGNPAGYPSKVREPKPLHIPFNTSFKNQKIYITGMNKAFPGAPSWHESDFVMLQNKPLEKIIGFNTDAQPHNFEAMKCIISFY
jgi:hypothetical protein